MISFPAVATIEPELLARHFTQAGLAEPAIEWWGKAGQRSLEHSALVEAIEQFTRAMDKDRESCPPRQHCAAKKSGFRWRLSHPSSMSKATPPPKPKRQRNEGLRLIEQAQAIGDPPEDPLLLFSALYGVGGYNTCAVQWRLRAADFSSVVGFGQEGRNSNFASARTPRPRL